MVESQDVGRALQAWVSPIFKHHYENFIADVPEAKPGATPATYVLAAGYAGGEPFIVDMDPHGLIGHHEETGFQAVGSGSPMAQQAYALLASYQTAKRGVDYGVVAALRVLDALDASSPSVGPPMDIAESHPKGHIISAPTRSKRCVVTSPGGWNSRNERSTSCSLDRSARDFAVPAELLRRPGIRLGGDAGVGARHGRRGSGPRRGLGSSGVRRKPRRLCRPRDRGHRRRQAANGPRRGLAGPARST